MWNLEKWYRCNYLQDRNRDSDVENRCVNGDELGYWEGHIHITMYITDG